MLTILLSWFRKTSLVLLLSLLWWNVFPFPLLAQPMLGIDLPPNPNTRFELDLGDRDLGSKGLGSNSDFGGVLDAVSEIEVARAEPGRTQSQNLSDQERQQIIQQILNSPRLQGRSRNQRLRVIHLSLVSTPKASRAQSSSKQVSAVVFDYNTSKASRVIVNHGNGQIVAILPLRGRPQPSPEERQEAQEIALAQPDLAKLLAAGGQFEGGFTVDAPQKRFPKNHRYIQLKILSANRQTLQKVIVVNLTTRAVVSASPTFR